MTYFAVGLVALVAALMFLFFRRRATESRAPWRQGARVERRTMLPIDLDSAEQRVRALLTTVGTERDAADLPDARVIEAVTPSNWKTSGTVVRVVLRGSAQGSIADISAWPGAQLFDWGQSRRVVDRIASQLG